MGPIIPFESPIQPSRRLLAMQIIMHALALAAVLAVPLHWGFRAVLAIPVLVSLALRWKEYQRPHHGRLAIKPDGLWLMTYNGAWVRVDILGDSVAHPWLTVLRFRVAGHSHTQSLALPPDSLSGDAHRRLRVWLRWGRPHGGEAAAML